MYENYYGFKERPFQLSPDPRFFFASSNHQRAMSYLQYGLDQGEGFIVVTGPIGTGKTTIARNLLNNIADDSIIAAQLVTTKLDPTELLELVASEFKIAVKGNSKAELLQAIEKFLIESYSSYKLDYEEFTFLNKGFDSMNKDFFLIIDKLIQYDIEYEVDEKNNIKVLG